MNLTSMTAHELHDLLQSRQVGAEELLRAFLARIEQIEVAVHSFVTIDTENALIKARKLDRRLLSGEYELGPLEGIPMAIKDNISTSGLRTTCSSRILENFIPPYDATVTRKLRSAGAILLGKLNMDEFAMGSSTENSGFFPTRNPWDLGRVPGGSSGGAAAATVAGEATYTLGSDTGGSIRQPAAFCGVVGLKPTYGRVSRFGLVAFASSLDQIGPLTLDVRDCSLVLSAIAGYDELDSTSADLPVADYASGLTEGIRGLRIGVPKEYFASGLEPAVEQAIRRVLDSLERDLGVLVQEVSLPHTEYALPVYYLIAPAEASSNLARFDGVGYGLRCEATDIISMYKKTRSEGFGPEVKRRVMLGTYALSSGYYDAYYLKALKVRRLVKEDFDRAFEKFDLLVGPTTPSTAFRLGEKSGDPLSMYLSDLFTIPVNLAGMPALSLPCGLSPAGLPIGLQIMGPPFSEGLILRTAYNLEQVNSWDRLRLGLEVKIA